MANQKDVSVQSMVGARTGQPAVMFRLGDEYVNMPVADARKVALDLLNAALAAEQDAALVLFLRGQGMSDQEAGVFLGAIRAARGV